MKEAIETNRSGSEFEFYYLLAGSSWVNCFNFCKMGQNSFFFEELLKKIKLDSVLIALVP